MTAHTPGPWFFVDGSVYSAAADGFLIAIPAQLPGVVVDGKFQDTPETWALFEQHDANARLIAAAPKLLLATKTLIECAEIADEMLDAVGKEHGEIKKAIELARKFVAEAEAGT